ncbi:hypothetical protein, partial [Priestia megaterium]
MELLDAQVINTQYGLEIYVDNIDNVKVKALYAPDLDNEPYEIMIGVKYFLLRDRYYETKENYFWININNDNVVMLKESNTESLFAVKNESEREATKDLIGKWLIKTNTFKHAVIDSIEEQKKENIQSEIDITQVTNRINFLERVLQIKTEDIE